ncbi:bacillibactin transport transcriptional regulator Btr [Paenibacillus sp. YSY-4.3]
MKPKTMDTETFLHSVLYEIEAVFQSTSLPEWADGQQPMNRHLLLFIEKGRGELVVNGTASQFTHRSLHIYPPGTVLEMPIKQAGKAALYGVVFNLFKETENTGNCKLWNREAGFPLQGYIEISDDRFLSLLRLLVSLGEEAVSKKRYIARQYLQDMLEILLAEVQPAAANDLHQRIKATLEYMHAYYHEDIRVDKLAAIAQLHPSYYSRVFKKMMFKSPVAYLTDLRMNKAKELLLTTDKSVRDVAAVVGYGDEFYFSRRFKDTSGYSPTFFTRKKELKLISLSSPYTDHLYTLGLKPSAAQLHRHIPLSAKPLQLPEHASDPWEISRQIFLEEAPDLIVCKDNVLHHARAHIHDIAPIVAIPWASKDVYTHLLEIADLVDRRQAALGWLDHHEQAAERVRQNARQTIGRAVVTICVYRGQELRIYGARNIGHVFYRSLQLAPPDRVREQMEPFPEGTGFTWTSITPDELKFYESDILFIAVERDSDRQQILKWQRTNPSWMNHPAVRSKRVYFLDRDKWMNYAPFAINLQMEELEMFLHQGLR